MTAVFRVGEWLVKPNLNRISQPARAVSIEPRIIEVLVFLAAHPGEVLSKETLIGAVWPGTFVSDDVLTYSISELRKALGDDAKNPRYIQTIARKGYRLIAPVRSEPGALRALPSIAVMAFSDLSPEKDQDYFCDGIAEDIIHDLAHVRGLRVAARTSSFAFKGKSEDVRTIGKKLGVGTVLEGSVRKAGNRIRITAQLIKVEDGSPLWSERYDKELKDIFEIQDEISRSIAAALEVTLSPNESDAISKVPTLDMLAYDYYLRGKQFYYQYKRRGIEFALKMFTQAIEIDPNYVRAHAGISDCCAFLFMYAGSHEEHRLQAAAASRKAADLDPESAEAHASRGVALSLERSYEDAEEEFQESIRLNPQLFEAYYFYARVAFARGDLVRAIDLYEKAAEVQPHDYQSPLLMAQIYADLGREADAEEARKRGVQRVENRLKLNPDDSRALYMGANGLVALGETERGLSWAAQAQEMDPDEPMVLYNVACIQSLAGKVEDAISSLERAVKNGLSQKGWLENDSNLAPLRANARYQDLIRYLDEKNCRR